MGARSQLLPGITRVSPDIFIRVFFFYPAKKRSKTPLIFRFKGIAAKHRQPINIVGLEKFKQVLFRFFGKGLSIVKSPGFRLKTTRTVISAAGNKKADADTQTVCDIAVLIAPYTWLKDAARVL